MDEKHWLQGQRARFFSFSFFSEVQRTHSFTGASALLWCATWQGSCREKHALVFLAPLLGWFHPKLPASIAGWLLFALAGFI